jgi:hypothetical protein
VGAFSLTTTPALFPGFYTQTTRKMTVINKRNKTPLKLFSPQRLLIFLLLSLLVIFAAIGGIFKRQDFDSNLISNIISLNEEKRDPKESLISFNQRLYPRRKLGDDCYHVFLDVGANIGVHTRFLLESPKYPDAKIAAKYFNSIFGENLESRDPRDFCTFAFEPNPAHRPRHIAFKKAYDAVGWNYWHIPAGVSNQPGNISFYHVDGEETELGFSAVNRDCKDNPKCREEVLPVIRLADWIDEHVRHRRLPKQVYGKYATPGPTVGKPRRRHDFPSAGNV